MSTVAIVIGPTAVGKTEILIEALRGLKAEIISADSRQIYRFMDIGTAKPDREQLGAVKHHLVDCVNPDRPIDAADYARMACRVIDDVIARGRFAVVSGGSGLYIRALLEGFFDGPGADDGIRRNLLEQERTEGRGTLHRRLSRIDPDSAARIHPNDLFRTVRALEVFEQSGIPLTRWHREGANRPLEHESFAIGLYRSRKELYRRIDRRVDRMMELGFEQEVEGLIARSYSEDSAALSTVGYREMIALHQGQISRPEAIARTKRDTRQYAKRQMTWFNKMEPVLWIDAARESGIHGPARLARVLEDLSCGRHPSREDAARSRQRMRQAWSWNADRGTGRSAR
jgi:tRNA dimethylallyltransferase